jgi:post-segregation antitoxin (ccd killing protein)
VVVEYHEVSEKTSVVIPRYLRLFARKEGINISATIRNVLEEEYERSRGKATNHGPGLAGSNHTHGDDDQ